MKKRLIMLLIAAICCMFGCKDDSKETVVYDDGMAEELSENVIKCFKDEDEKELEMLFCQKIKESGELSTEIREAFAYINGEIVSHDMPKGSTGGGIIENGKRTELSMNGKVTNIKTETGKVYSIYIHSYAINTKKEDYVGITNIDIYLESELVNDNKDSGIQQHFSIGDFLE